METVIDLKINSIYEVKVVSFPFQETIDIDEDNVEQLIHNEESEDCDEEISEDSNDTESTSLLYGSFSKNQSFLIKLVDVEVRIQHDTAILIIKFVCEDEPDFSKINESIKSVQFWDADSFISEIKSGSNSESVWFSDLFINQTEDEEKIEYFDNKKIWSLKWSRPNNMPNLIIDD